MSELKMNEMNLNEMENVSGGRGGSPTKLPEKAGYWVYRIQSGDCLSRIAGRYGTTAAALKRCNKTITNINDITAGYYIYIPN